MITITTPHTDAEVLSGAIEILEREGMWCKNTYYTLDEEAREKLSFCAEGAIREVAGLWDYIDGYKGLSVDQTNEFHFIDGQCRRLERLTLKHSGCSGSMELNGFNDADTTTQSDVLLAMKKALNEVENG